MRLKFDSASGFAAGIVAGTILGAVVFVIGVGVLGDKTDFGPWRIGLLALTLVVFVAVARVINGVVEIGWSFDADAGTLRIERWVFGKPTLIEAHQLRDVGLIDEPVGVLYGDASIEGLPPHLVLHIDGRTIDLGAVGPDAYDEVHRIVESCWDMGEDGDANASDGAGNEADDEADDGADDGDEARDPDRAA